MKQLQTLFALTCLLAATLYAQVPQGFKYQAVARDAVGNIMQNEELELRISLTDGSEDGQILFSEIHHPKTNRFGLFSLEIGNGSELTNKFSEVNWARQNVWLKVEMNSGGSNQYRLLGSSELLSVPYALHAASASSIHENGNTRALADSAWLLNGNAGTSATVDYIGTSDFEDMVFKSNSVERLRVKAQGEIGIGTISPSTNLEIVGDFRAGDGSNYAQITPIGDLFFKATADYLVGPDRYAFRYMLNEDYGLFFSGTNNEYEFLTSGQNRIFSVHANSGRVHVLGRLGVGTATPVAKAQIIGDARIGTDSSDYAQFGGEGDLVFYGNADYLVRPNTFAFRYAVNENYGLFFNSSTFSYEFKKDAAGNAGMSVHATTGNTDIAGTLGVGLTGNPVEQAEIGGAIKIGNTTTNNAGAIKYNGTDFLGYDGTTWHSLTADGDDTNELQELVGVGSTIGLTNGTATIDLSPYLDNTDQQTLSIAGQLLTISNGNTVTLPVNTGPTGPTGAQGVQGGQGATGPTGAVGPQGNQGSVGPTGAQGNQGIQGITGPTGSQGIQGVQGIAGPSGTQGLQGPSGPTGPQGIQGVMGVSGPTGAQGIQGIQGVAGPSGTQGIQGIAGPTGQPGPAGAVGPTGLQGLQGIQGATGPAGALGIQGPVGPT